MQRPGLTVAGSAITSEMRILEAAKPDSAWKVVLSRQTDVEYEIAHRGDHLFILLRDPERPNSELLVAPIADPTKTTVSCLSPRQDGLAFPQCLALAAMMRCGCARASSALPLGLLTWLSMGMLHAHAAGSIFLHCKVECLEASQMRDPHIQ